MKDKNSRISVVKVVLAFYVKVLHTYILFFIVVKYNIKFAMLNIFKCTVQWHLVFLQCCATVTTILSKTLFCHTRGKPHAH